ncbi:MAG: ribosomal L7Ae/L30e/S12e/Gadd45 family protein [Lachnospiraceae bacterium]|nr:ribosomal L7Ae/L30e/S12e/Gadd45 family protein [Lachnospiraceae bacterium]MCR5532001.1 ribosomal L7Ae/L30e/S12e/Gadd45 family protein [Lachnospiraceae bacterium]
MTDRILSMIGLARKAGKLTSGETLCEDAVRKGKACLLILASDAAKNSSKNLTDSTNYYKVPLVVYGTKESLGKAIGSGQRSAVCITDPGIAQKIVSLIH